jgi:8-oxo-dGTP pyrophosphatase MutT (NUDIX family)
VHSSAMSAVRSVRSFALREASPDAGRMQAPVSSLRLSRLRKMREFDQVAAVCYRVRGGAIEFLLVQTRGSARWTFPKGCAEAGLTHAQAAAMEAFEEAGVHGRIEEAAFARYQVRGNARKGRPLVVSAHLCEVTRLSAPKESKRNRTWFSVQEANKKLGGGRNGEDTGEFARVIKKAVERISRWRGEKAVARNPMPLPAAAGDGLYQVQFEARSENPKETFSAPYGSRLPRARKIVTLAEADYRREESSCEVLPFAALRQVSRGPKLLPGRKN